MQIPITGMTCQGCVSSIEGAVKKIKGAQDVSVSLALKQLSVEGVELDEVLATVRGLGYDSPADRHHNLFKSSQIDQIASDETAAARRDFLGAAILGVPEFLIGMHWLPMALVMAVPTWAQAIMATAVVLFFGRSIHIRTFKQLRHGVLTMDTLVTLGSFAALVQSFALWSRGTEHSSFEAASTIVVFILLGRFLEARARRSTFSATSSLYQTLEAPVIRIVEGKETRVSALELMAGDEIKILPGETCPVDGVVKLGQAQIDVSRITGEGLPIKISPTQSILSGSTILDSPITLRVTRAGTDSFLGKLLLELEKAQGQPVQLQRLADRVTTFFVPTVILLACSASLYQFWATQNPVFAFNIFLSVVLVACPCALGLAIPTALVAGLGASAKRGILFRDAATLERCSAITDIYFDKTGTLTAGAPQLTRVEISSDLSEKEILELAARCEKDSIHPLAQAIKNAAYKKGIFALKPVTHFKVVPGKGVECQIGEKHISVLRVEVEVHATLELDQTGTASDVFVDNKKVGRLYFVDAPRTEAKAILDQLITQGLKLHLLTGDNKSSIDQLRDWVGASTFTTIESELLPTDKQNVVASAREKTPRGVAFVGDGVNDVLALQAATIGFAVASGSPAAIGSGNVTLTRGITDLPLALEMAQATYSQLKFNLFWAFAYNAVMIPAAVLGQFNPIWASLAMSASSVSVVLGSLYLGVKLRI